jgi:hypothetical protein
MSRSNPWKQKSRQTRHTTLIVVEGDTEYAFVKYLKGLCGRDCGTRVTIENGHGGGGDSVLRKTIQLGTAYDVCVCLYDTDRMPTAKGHIRKAIRLGIIEIASAPAIEALFLEILGQRPPTETAACKRALQQLLGDDKLTAQGTFEKHFPQDLLERQQASVACLDQLYGCIQRRSS